jgi:hypothetical protein
VTAPQPAPHHAAEHHGALALVVQPDGTAATERLPENPAAAVVALNEAIGGHFQAIGDSRWIAYTVEDNRDDGRPNPAADRLAELLGWHTHPMGGMCGPVVFLGRHGPDETDVPEDALALARRMGLIA